MRTALVIGVIMALATGLAISSQATPSSRMGDICHPFPTGMLTNLLGELMARLIVLDFVLRPDFPASRLPGQALTLLLNSRGLGLQILGGSFSSLSRTGITTGLSTIILGSLVIFVIVDTTGWRGANPTSF